MDKKKILDIFNRLELFQNFNQMEKQAILDLSSQFCLYKQDEAIMKENEPGSSFHILLSGEVQVYKNRAEIAQLDPGDFFGEMSLLTGEPRSTTVVAICPSITYEIDEKVLNKLPLPVREKIKDLFIDRLVHRLKYMNEQAT